MLHINHNKQPIWNGKGEKPNYYHPDRPITIDELEVKDGMLTKESVHILSNDPYYTTYGKTMEEISSEWQVLQDGTLLSKGEHKPVHYHSYDAEENNTGIFLKWIALFSIPIVMLLFLLWLAMNVIGA